MPRRAMRAPVRVVYLLVVAALAVAVYAAVPADVRRAIYETYLKAYFEPGAAREASSP